MKPQQPQQQPQPQPRESFGLLFERVPGGGYRIQIATVDATGKRTLMRPRGPETATSLTAVAEVENIRERIENWLVGKYQPLDDKTLEAAK